MITNLAPVSLSNKKVNSYTCLRLTFLKKNSTVYAYKSICEPLDLKIFFGGGGEEGMPPEPRSLAASSFSEVWLRPCPLRRPLRRPLHYFLQLGQKNYRPIQIGSG